MGRNQGPTLVQIGKNGITENTIEEIVKNINKNKDLRVKLLRNFLGSSDRHEAVKKIYAELDKKMNFSDKFDGKLVGNILLIRKKSN